MTSDDIVARLRVWSEHDSDECISDMREAADEIERLRAERDAARREVCDRVATPRYNIYIPIATAKRYAEERGWDCFKEAKP